MTELPEPQPCVHCGRSALDFAGGYARLDAEPVCHPNGPGRPDCFRMITVYGHPTRSCERCAEQPWEPLTRDEIIASVMASVVRTQEMVNDIYPMGLLTLPD